MHCSSRLRFHVVGCTGRGEAGLAACSAPAAAQRNGDDPESLHPGTTWRPAPTVSGVGVVAQDCEQIPKRDPYLLVSVLTLARIRVDRKAAHLAGVCRRVRGSFPLSPGLKLGLKSRRVASMESVENGLPGSWARAWRTVICHAFSPMLITMVGRTPLDTPPECGLCSISHPLTRVSNAHQ